MIVLTESETEEITEAFVVANTVPSFQRWLERNGAVRRIAETATQDELLDGLQAILRTEEPTETHYATAYAYLIALAMRQARNGRIGALPVASGLEWAEKMWRYARRNPTTSTIFVTGTIPETQIIERYEDSGAGGQLVDAHGMPLVRVTN